MWELPAGAKLKGQSSHAGNTVTGHKIADNSASPSPSTDGKQQEQQRVIDLVASIDKAHSLVEVRFDHYCVHMSFYNWCSKYFADMMVEVVVRIHYFLCRRGIPEKHS